MDNNGYDDRFAIASSITQLCRCGQLKKNHFASRNKKFKNQMLQMQETFKHLYL